jgi:hypothetical protein
MNHECTRRSLLQLLGITIGAAAVIPAHLNVEPSRDEPMETEQLLSSPTQLERFIRSHGIKPAPLARESGYSRQHLLRLRLSRIRPSIPCIAALLLATQRLTGQRVTPDDLFAPETIHVACRDTCASELQAEDRDDIRHAFGRRTVRELLGGQA